MCTLESTRPWADPTLKESDMHSFWQADNSMADSDNASSLFLSVQIPGLSKTATKQPSQTMTLGRRTRARSHQISALTTKDIAAATSTDDRNARRRRTTSTSSSTSQSDMSCMSFSSASLANDTSDSDCHSLNLASGSTTSEEALEYVTSKLQSQTPRQGRTQGMARERVASAPNLQINTFLPLTMPPQERIKRQTPATASPIPAFWQESSTKRTPRSVPSDYTMSRCASNSDGYASAHSDAIATAPSEDRFVPDVDALDLQRSSSLSSFSSMTSSDGSWHGDAGDEDPDGQLERAVSATSLSTMPQQSLDKEAWPAYHDDKADAYFDAPTGTFDDVDENDIREHAGPWMFKVASLLWLDVGAFKADDDASGKQYFSGHAPLSDTAGDCPRRQSMMTSISSPSSLSLESYGLRTRTRSGSPAPRDLVSQTSNNNILSRLWAVVV